MESKLITPYNLNELKDYTNITMIGFEGDITLDLSHIVKIDCYNNEITSFSALPNCEELNCLCNEITSLPELPNCKILNCSLNKLTKLPDLPKCERLECDHNNIQSLPLLTKCKKLNANFNKIKFIHNKLDIDEIHLSNNQICYINEIKCKELFLTNNNLNFITDVQVFKLLVLNNNPLKDYNVLQLRQKYPNVEIQFDREVKNETYKFKYPCDLFFEFTTTIFIKQK